MRSTHNASAGRKAAAANDEAVKLDGLEDVSGTGGDRDESAGSSYAVGESDSERDEEGDRQSRHKAED